MPREENPEKLIDQEEIEDFIGKERGVAHVDKVKDNFNVSEEELMQEIENSENLSATKISLGNETEKLVSDADLQEIVEMGGTRTRNKEGPKIGGKGKALLEAEKQIRNKDKVNKINDKCSSKDLKEFKKKGFLKEVKKRRIYEPSENFDHYMKTFKKTLREIGLGEKLDELIEET